MVLKVSFLLLLIVCAIIPPSSSALSGNLSKRDDLFVSVSTMVLKVSFLLLIACAIIPPSSSAPSGDLSKRDLMIPQISCTSNFHPCTTSEECICAVATLECLEVGHDGARRCLLSHHNNQH
ncbi:hypothetical protein AC249_AIPGENE27035 [Exaiptasia diaphana]|nr:hypothetical protein AC249_AIPGENE27035 [Exaiptasia diaphana]